MGLHRLTDLEHMFSADAFRLVDHSLDLYSFSRVRSVNVTWQDDSHGDLVLVLVGGNQDLIVRCLGVRELVLPTIGQLLFLPELEIEDVSDRGLEGIRFEFASHTERDFVCLCRDIVIDVEAVS